MEDASTLEVLYAYLPSLGIFVTALFVVIHASKRSLATDKLLNDNEELREGLTLKTTTVLLFPVIASISLLSYFYFWSFISIFVTFSTIFVSMYSIAFFCEPITSFFKSTQLETVLLKNSCFGDISVIYILLYGCSIGFVGAWLTTGHWVLNDVIGIAICTVFIGFIRVPNLKLLVYLLVGLFFYDIFWVFYSSRFFGSNVMEKVATQKSTNPMNAIVSAAPTQISLPTSITICGCCGCHSLGLGDIALPGTFISFLYRHESYKGTGLRLFNVAVGGYGVGLLVAFGFLTVFRVAQPALLYLVPCAVLPILVLGYMRGDLIGMWHGLPNPPPSVAGEKNREV